VAFSVPRIQQADQVSQRAQDQVVQLANKLDKQPLLGGVLLEDIVFVQNVARRVGHGLGRRYLGYIITKQDQTGNLINSPSSESDPKIELGLVSSTSMTCSLWVF
jgi:hypothetical protein